MPLSITVDGVALTNRVRLNDGTNNGIDGLTSAADGSGSMGGIIIDDPNHDLVLQGWQTCIVEESDCTSAPRLFTGFIGDRTMTHGNYPTDGGRQVNVTLWDQNSLLSWALITGTDGKRPSESRTARIDWLLGSDYLDTIVFDTGFVVPSGSSNFQEADYRDQYPRDVLDDVLGAFQVAFAFWDEAAGKIGLFYDDMGATTMDSTLSISNDLDDITFADGVVSGTCWPPYIDAELAQDPSEVYSLEDLTYTGGKLLRTDAATKAQFFPSPYPHRGQATDRSRIGKATTASDYINALLAQASAEKETVTCTLLLPSTHVGLVEAGQRISARFVHLDGWESFQYARITSRTTRQALGRQDMYEVQLTLNQRGPFGGGGGGGGSNPPPTTFPPGTPSAEYVQRKWSQTTTIDFDHDVTAGHLLTFFGVMRSATIAHPTGTGSSAGSGWTLADTVQVKNQFGVPQGSYGQMFYKIADGNEGHNFHNTQAGALDVIEWDDGVTFSGFVSQTLVNAGISHVTCGGTGTPSAGDYVIGGAALGQFGNPGAEYSFVAAAGITEIVGLQSGMSNPPAMWVGDIPGGASGLVDGTWATSVGSPDLLNWAGITFWVSPDTSAVGPPAPGQPIGPETVTMSGANGTTANPFADGTLRVFVDNTDQTGAITAQDGATGDFTLGFTPFVGEVVTVFYRGR